MVVHGLGVSVLSISGEGNEGYGPLESEGEIDSVNQSFLIW